MKQILVKLPTGKKNNDYTYDIILVVTDSFGSENTASASVRVATPNVDDLAQYSIN